MFFNDIHTPAYDLEVKVTDLEICANQNVKFYVKVFKTLYFLRLQMDLLYI